MLKPLTLARLPQEGVSVATPKLHVLQTCPAPGEQQPFLSVYTYLCDFCGFCLPLDPQPLSLCLMEERAPQGLALTVPFLPQKPVPWLPFGPRRPRALARDQGPCQGPAYWSSFTPCHGIPRPVQIYGSAPREIACLLPRHCATQLAGPCPLC